MIWSLGLLGGGGLVWGEEAGGVDVEGALRVLREAPRLPEGATKTWNPEVSREYGTKGVLVVRRKNGEEEQYPYVELPVHFVVNSAEYRDEVSRANLKVLAEVVGEVLRGAGEAEFRVEGHASAEGPEERNRELSEERAERVRAALAAAGGMKAEALRAVGYGKEHARHGKSAPEEKLREDRRVLVVRVR